MKQVERMTRDEILAALAEDGFDIDPRDAAAIAATIRAAARRGALLWGRNRVVCTLRERPLTLLRRNFTERG